MTFLVTTRHALQHQTANPGLQDRAPRRLASCWLALMADLVAWAEMSTWCCERFF